MSIKIFFCYAHKDEELLNKLKAHLRPLERQGFIDMWHDRDINAGAEWEREIHQQLNAAQIILLLVSSDFMNSDFCYGIEMERAMERHELGEAIVIPVILRPVLWQNSPFSKLEALPKQANRIMTSQWYSIDHALLDVAEGISKTVKMLLNRKSHEEEMQRVSLRIKREWNVLGASVRGASHVRNGIPNQDAILWRMGENAGLPIVIAISDGLGNDKSFRSDIGARLAVQVAVEEMERFALSLPPTLTNMTLVKYLAKLLPDKIVQKWGPNIFSSQNPR